MVWSPDKASRRIAVALLVVVSGVLPGCTEDKKKDADTSLLPRNLRPQPKRLADLTKGESGDEELTQIGFRLADTASWLKGADGKPYYEWVSWDAVCHFAADDAKKSYSLIELDTKTTKSKVLEPLTKVYSAEGNFGPGRMAPSTNRLLFMGERPGSPPKYYIADDKGNEYRQWEFHGPTDRTKAPYASISWTPESHVMETVVGPGQKGKTKIQTWIYKAKDYETAEALPTVEIDALPKVGTVPYSRGGNKFFMIVPDVPNEASPNVKIVQWEASVVPKQKVFDVSFDDQYVHDWKPAEDGLFIMWATTTCPTGPTAWIRSPENANDKPTDPQYIRIWITKNDGTGHRELGRLELKPGSEAADIDSFSGMRWVTNRLFVSFLFRGGLWEIYI
ncbi:MAG: hypothetical protein JST30_06080 [Armatimonadetes bacterium]|nr:hypothetical protein [Armatimonadota bacterium]